MDVEKIAAKVRCTIFGHARTTKTIAALKFCSAHMETCDRCGDGEVELTKARCIAAHLEKTDDPE